MIGKLKGTIAEIFVSEVLLETQSGIFFLVYATPDLLHQHTVGDAIEVYTYHLIREDAQQLFGFTSYDQLRMFRALIAVDGVGAKTAYAIIATSSVEAIRNAVRESDVQFFQSVKGIGKKTAQRILVDVSESLGADFDLLAARAQEHDDEAIEALMSLGFKQSEARDALLHIDVHLPIEEKVKRALRSLART